MNESDTQLVAAARKAVELRLIRMNRTPHPHLWIDALQAVLESADEDLHDEARADLRLIANMAEDNGALMLIARLREALGDNGKRMQNDLVEWCKTLRPKEEIEKAWVESRQLVGCWGECYAITNGRQWDKSRAKRVMDGVVENPEVNETHRVKGFAAPGLHDA